MSDDKPIRAPWDNTPFVDPGSAAQKAIAAARRASGDPKSAAVQSWARKAFDDEIELLKTATERNNQLFKTAANLYEIVAAGALNESVVENALHDACMFNRSIQDDGEPQFNGTLKSARRKGFDNPRDLSQVGTKPRNSVVLDNEPVQIVSLDEIAILERGFWTQRESLQTIYLAALSRMCSPWAVLGHCAARALTLVRPNCVLPPIIGGVGSLNWFCAIAAKSGGGKDSAVAVAEKLVEPLVLIRNLGSGEGVIDSYVKPKDQDGKPRGLRESVMFVADEIDTMAVLSQRAGATLPSILRSGFSGGTLGFSYRTASDLHLPKHSYRMTLVISVQPAKAGALIDDAYGGTLQRFMWFPGSDWRITNEPPPMPAALNIPPPATWEFSRTLEIPYEAIELIRDERVRINTGKADDIDGHALYIREKFAYALAVLDNRDKLTLEDWNLAGIASRVSNHTRNWVRSELLQAQERNARETGRLQGVKFNASDEEKARQVNMRLGRIATKIQRKIYDARPEGITHRDLVNSLTPNDRPYLPQTLERLEGTGAVEQVKGQGHGKRYRWAESR